MQEMQQFQQKIKAESAEKIKTASFVTPIAGKTGLENAGQVRPYSGAKRDKALAVELVRQPDKEGIERFVDETYQQRLSEVEQQFEQLMAERQAKGRGGDGSQEDEDGAPKKEWYQQ